MPWGKTSRTETRYALVCFDEEGLERRDDRDAAPGCFTEKVIDELSARPPTDCFMFSHGWMADVGAAIHHYDTWIDALVGLQADFARMQARPGGFAPLFVGVHWPSLPWGDEEIGAGVNFAAQGASTATFVESYAKRLRDTPRVREALEVIIEEARTNAAADSLTVAARNAYVELNESLGLGNGQLGGPPEADREPFDPDAAVEASLDLDLDFGGLDLGGAFLAPLRQLSFWMMKKRACMVGEGGIHALLQQLQAASPNARVHLMGHSFGCIVASSALGGTGCADPLARPVDSCVLVQGAMSLWSFASNIPPAPTVTGYFRSVLADGNVRGPMVATTSTFDSAVGIIYPAAAGVAGQASFAGLPKYGAIGTFGICGVDGAIAGRMVRADQDYEFAAGKVYNLESSEFICHGAGPGGAHGDITGPEVAHAIWQAALV
jgi:hypothetical protein